VHNIDYRGQIGHVKEKSRIFLRGNKYHLSPSQKPARPGSGIIRS
jgi:hypothetical protein